MTIRATQAELDELGHYRQQRSSATLGSLCFMPCHVRTLGKPAFNIDVAQLISMPSLGTFAIDIDDTARSVSVPSLLCLWL